MRDSVLSHSQSFGCMQTSAKNATLVPSCAAQHHVTVPTEKEMVAYNIGR